MIKKSCFGLSLLMVILSIGCSQQSIATTHSHTTLAAIKQNDQGENKLKRIFFNVYTDSIKPVMNFYVAVDAEMEDGSFLPMDENLVILLADKGSINGMEWIPPKIIDFEKVTFKVKSISNPKLQDELTIYMRKIWNKEAGIKQMDEVLPHRSK